MAFILICWIPICDWSFLEGSLLEKKKEKRLFFRVATAGLGKYRMNGYGCIWVYRVNIS